MDQGETRIRRSIYRHVFDSSGLFGQELVFAKMSRHRFDSISRCFHSDAPWDLSPQERERRNKQDPFWQTDKFCEHLCENFMHYWLLGQCSDLDECSCGFRGKHKCRCFNPAKPHKCSVGIVQRQVIVFAFTGIEGRKSSGRLMCQQPCGRS